MPTYLYLNEPGSRWELADDVDVVDLQRQLDGARFGSLQTEVLVDGLRGPLIIRHDQMYPYAIVEVGGNAPDAASVGAPRGCATGSSGVARNMAAQRESGGGLPLARVRHVTL